ncbi:MAG: hypothetical protein ABIK07_23640, partial [Planctomycetota bacterium]
APLLQRKQTLIREQHAASSDQSKLIDQMERRRHNRQRFRELRNLDAKLALLTSKLRGQINEDLDTVRQQMKANAVIQSREISFVLYPERVLKELFDKLTFE